MKTAAAELIIFSWVSHSNTDSDVPAHALTRSNDAELDEQYRLFNKTIEELKFGKVNSKKN